MKSWIAAAFVVTLAGGPALADVVPPPPAPPSTPDPSAITEPAGFVRDLYTRYFAALNAWNANPDAPREPSMEWDAIADTHFTPALRDRMKKALSGPDPVFDWDFFIDGQDFADLAIVDVTAETVDAKSVVAITTSNFNQKSTTRIELEKLPEGWRIADMEFFIGKPEIEPLRLTDILKEAGF